MQVKKANKEGHQTQRQTDGAQQLEESTEEEREREKERFMLCIGNEGFFFPPLHMLIKCLILILFIIINSSNGPKYLNELK